MLILLLCFAVPRLSGEDGIGFAIPVQMMQEQELRAPVLTVKESRALLAAVEREVERMGLPGGSSPGDGPISLADFGIGTISLKAAPAFLILMARDSAENAHSNALCTHGNCLILIYERHDRGFRPIFHADGFAIGRSEPASSSRGSSRTKPGDLVLARSAGGGLVQLQQYAWRSSGYQRQGCQIIAPRGRGTESSRWWLTKQTTLQSCSSK